MKRDRLHPTRIIYYNPDSQNIVVESGKIICRSFSLQGNQDRTTRIVKCRENFVEKKKENIETKTKVKKGVG